MAFIAAPASSARLVSSDINRLQLIQQNRQGLSRTGSEQCGGSWGRSYTRFTRRGRRRLCAQPVQVSLRVAADGCAIAEQPQPRRIAVDAELPRLAVHARRPRLVDVVQQHMQK